MCTDFLIQVLGTSNDELDQLKTEQRPDGTTIEYTYDGFGNRTKIVKTKDGSSMTTTADYNADVVQSYVYGENGQLLAMKKGGATYFYHYNAHGDVIALTDAQGNVVARYEYDTWGQLLSKSGEMAAENPYRYAGYQYDEETGLYYLMARYYHPTHGVFLSMDPDPGDADDILTQNGYTYANNNPVMLVDPDGHFFWFVVNAGFAAYDGYKAYKSGKGWKGVAVAAAFGFVGGGRFKAAKQSVYVLKKGNVVKYVGRTKNIKKRRYVHSKNHPDLDFEEVASNLSWGQARGLEHRLYLKHGGKSKLRNKIRPISKRNKTYRKYMSESRRVYKEVVRRYGW